MIDIHVVWFKRDLRLDDHEPFTTAAGLGTVLPLYVYEPSLLDQSTFDARHHEFAEQCLVELDNDLRRFGTRLVRRYADVPDVFERLRAELGGSARLAAVHVHQETTDLAGYRRDEAFRRWATTQRIDVHEYVDRGVVRGLRDRDGWAALWKARMSRPIIDAPDHIAGIDVDAGRAPTLDELGIAPSTCTDLQQGGRRAGLDTLASFLDARAEPYATAMSSPVTAFEHCSRLSPHLAFGTVSGREVFQATRDRIDELRDDPDRGTWLKSLRAFEKRLHWRDHFTQKLEDEPTLEIAAMHPMLDDLRPELDAERFERFRLGQTGFPMVDACMRATDATGWLNFRMRAMVVSFATYHLWLDWRPVAELLARMWTDYEPGIHYPQHQMQSGSTGMNALRIYSPTKQVHDHDPTGAFIRTWIPELRHVDDRHLAEPHRAPPNLLSSGAEREYPEPIVDHTEATRTARSRIETIRRTPEARAISDDIVERHGSRRPRQRSRKG